VKVDMKDDTATHTDLMPALRRLSRLEKILVMQFLASELALDEMAQEEEWEQEHPRGRRLQVRQRPASSTETVEDACPIWSPHDAFQSARSLLQNLKAEAEAQKARSDNDSV